LFEHKKTKEIVLETEENSLRHIDLSETLLKYAERFNIPQNLAGTKNWNEIFHNLMRISNCLDSSSIALDFATALAEIVDVESGMIGRRRETAIHTVVRHQNMWEGENHILEVLFERSEANPNFKNIHHQTALHIAAHFNQSSSIEMLLKHGANIDEVDEFLMTPLMLAVESGGNDAAEVLLSFGADPNLKGREGQTALHYASHFVPRYGNVSSIESLLKHGAKIDEVDENLMTALMIATRDGTTTLMEELLSHGADPNLIDRHENSALHHAVTGNYHSPIKLLWEYGAKIGPDDNKLKILLKWMGISEDTIKRKRKVKN
jgi:hypothetical protein